MTELPPHRTREGSAERLSVLAAQADDLRAAATRTAANVSTAANPWGQRERNDFDADARRRIRQILAALDNL